MAHPYGSVFERGVCYTLRMSDKLKDLMERVEHWPADAQKEAVASLEAIEEDFIVDVTLAHDLERARKEMRAGRGTSQEKVFEQFGV